MGHDWGALEKTFNVSFGKTGNKVILNDATKFLDGRSRISQVEVLEACTLVGTQPMGSLFDMVAENLFLPIQLAAILANHEAIAYSKEEFSRNGILQVDELGKVVATRFFLEKKANKKNTHFVTCFPRERTNPIEPCCASAKWVPQP